MQMNWAIRNTEAYFPAALECDISLLLVRYGLKTIRNTGANHHLSGIAFFIDNRAISCVTDKLLVSGNTGKALLFVQRVRQDPIVLSQIYSDLLSETICYRRLYIEAIKKKWFNHGWIENWYFHSTLYN